MWQQVIDSSPKQTNPPALFVALLGVGAVSLSIHVIMLQVLGVPFPLDDAPAWAKILNLAGTTTALIAFQVVARDKLGGFWRRVLLSGLILFMLKEGLRGALMNGVVTQEWVFALAGALPPLLISYGVAFMCALGALRVRSPAGILVAGLVAGGLAFLLQLVVGMAISPLMAALAHLARPDAYQLPYPLAVLVPAYLTFAEPVIGCALLVALCWDRLPTGLLARIASVTVLVVFIKGVVIRTLVFPAFMKQPFPEAMLSQSQFLLEFTALGALTALAWHVFGKASPEVPQ